MFLHETLFKLHSINKASRDFLTYRNTYLILKRDSAPARQEPIEFTIDVKKFG